MTTETCRLESNSKSCHAAKFKENHIPLNACLTTRSKSQFYLKILTVIHNPNSPLFVATKFWRCQTYAQQKKAAEQKIPSINLKYPHTPLLLHPWQLKPVTWTTFRETDATPRTEKVRRKETESLHHRCLLHNTFHSPHPQLLFTLTINKSNN